MIEVFEKLKKYNSWGDLKDLKTGFPRKNDLERISPYLGNTLVKAIVGQRRAGKSYFLRQIMEQLLAQGADAKSLVYLNKEYVEFDAIRNHLDLHELILFLRKRLKVKGKMFLFLDEIQEIEDWEKTVNSLAQDFRGEYEIFVTGSNSLLLSGELATLLTGRAVSFEVMPFSFAEYLACSELPPGKEAFLSYLKTGGLPELSHLQGEELKRHYVSSLRDSILLKDIVRRFPVRDEPLLDRLFLFLADNIGNLFSAPALLKRLEALGRQTSHETLSNYLRFLGQTFVFHEAERYDVKGKRILSGEKKYYLNDLAFRNYLTSGFDEGLGKHLENAVYLHYRRQGYQVCVGTVGKHEVDFVIEKAGDKQYVQVAYSIAEKDVADREFRSLGAIHDTYPKTIITLDDTSFGEYEGIQHRCAWELMG